jgi:hypothetical protein
MVLIEQIPATATASGQMPHQLAAVQNKAASAELQQPPAELIHAAPASVQVPLRERIGGTGDELTLSFELCQCTRPGLDPARFKQRSQKCWRRTGADREQWRSVIETHQRIVS